MALFVLQNDGHKMELIVQIMKKSGCDIPTTYQTQVRILSVMCRHDIQAKINEQRRESGRTMDGGGKRQSVNYR